MVPVDVVGLGVGVTAATATSMLTCALLSSGAVKCWGANSDGALGDGTTIDRRTPVDVVGLSGNVVAVSVGALGGCALLDDGKARCWGWFGFTADGGSTVPVDVPGLP
jgi:alpha-tubulin suppressor-like RCC1 family protein